MANGIVTNTLATLSYLVIATSSALTGSATTPSTPLTELPAFTQEYTYVVSAGDSVTGIAEKEYGSKDYWTTIMNDNPQILDPNKIEVGWELKLRIEKPVLIEELNEDAEERVASATAKPTISTPLAMPVVEVQPTVTPVQTQTTSYRPSNYDEVYKAAGAKYGVPWEILYGLHLTETGLRDGAIFNAQGSGARGPMQFMPGTWRAYGVDGNGDGVADIDNAVDAIHGAANFLARHGSLEAGLRSYGGNTSGVLAAAQSRGYTL